MLYFHLRNSTTDYDRSDIRYSLKGSGMMVLLDRVENTYCLAKNGLYKYQHLWIDPLHRSTNIMLEYNTPCRESEVIALLVRLLDTLLDRSSNEKRSLCYYTQCAQTPLTHQYSGKPEQLSVGLWLVLIAQR